MKWLKNTFKATPFALLCALPFSSMVFAMNPYELKSDDPEETSAFSPSGFRNSRNLCEAIDRVIPYRRKILCENNNFTDAEELEYSRIINDIETFLQPIHDEPYFDEVSSQRFFRTQIIKSLTQLIDEVATSSLRPLNFGAAPSQEEPEGNTPERRPIKFIFPMNLAEAVENIIPYLKHLNSLSEREILRHQELHQIIQKFLLFIPETDNLKTDTVLSFDKLMRTITRNHLNPQGFGEDAFQSEDDLQEAVSSDSENEDDPEEGARAASKKCQKKKKKNQKGKRKKKGKKRR